jgi:hypothetical protein
MFFLIPPILKKQNRQQRHNNEAYFSELAQLFNDLPVQVDVAAAGPDAATEVNLSLRHFYVRQKKFDCAAKTKFGGKCYITKTNLDVYGA